ncbi:glycoside hydrolase family 13 protein [Frigoribacterium sp. PhB116]|uniref:glycoside hydrolase family 13 protein n=1 Tax=Frigoribacterium sp. PhB116 TaxID=2485174 RepID=UPI00105CC758|nr:glycoside hydrolase family 13 protein [Frigoribacterium sp. PhB116]TDT66226.1 alpha-glucosidase [Frigoribacterium sp. PhB116]
MSSHETTGDTLDSPAETDTTTAPDIESTPSSGAERGGEWWRTAVIYQVYPRSFADADGDGVGDLPGITSRLDALADLGVDAVWLSPFYTSPQHDAGYDVADYVDVDPLFGTLDDFDALRARATELGLRLIVDLVPNHTSSEHAWFRAAVAAAPGSAERARYMFRDGTGPDGDLPPNNWQSVFGGPAWTRLVEPDGRPGQWYLHLFDTSQPDLDWTNPLVRSDFVDVLRFWLDRGVDGFRVDVAHGMIKADGLPDYTPPADAGSMGGGETADATPPYWAQDGVHEIYREWHQVLAEYPGDRVMVAEAWVEPLSKLAKWVRPDEMQQAFNFAYLETGWSATAIRRVVDQSIETFSSVGAPSTWVLSNHDVVRHASRLALTAENPQGHGIGPKSAGLPIPELGLARARAASAVMLALPGSAYLYQGEELGLPEAVDLPDESRQDPTWFRTEGERYGRDGCRVPIPWESGAPAFGFSATGASWLPQPEDWSTYARDEQQGVAGSTLELYRSALALRAEHELGAAHLTWVEGYDASVVAFRSGGVTVVANTGEVAVELPVGDVLLSTMALDGPALPPNAAVWLASVDDVG